MDHDNTEVYLIYAILLFIALLWFAAAAFAGSEDLILPDENIYRPYIETPLPPSYIEPAWPVVCANGAHPSCHPVNDRLCHGWCETGEYSYGDVFHYQGGKWKEHWDACREGLELYQSENSELRARCKKWRKR